jgi:putative nucleotidyltransferase with HDIG domain
MSPEFDGPESERWIEPFASYLAEHAMLPRVSFEHVRGLLPQMDLRIGSLAVLRGDMSARDVYRVLAAGQDREVLFGQLAVELGILEDKQVAGLLQLQQSPFHQFCEALLFTDSIKREELQSALASFMKEEGLGQPDPEDDPPTLSRRELHWREEHLFQALERVRGMATLPGVVMRVLQLLDNENSSFEEISEVIQNDPALAAQMLRVANSAAFGMRSRVENVHDAMRAVGTNAVRRLVLISAVMNKFSPHHLPAARELWEHSILTACWARSLARPMSAPPSESFLPGLLHDIGKMVLLQSFPEEAARIDKLAQGDTTREQAERMVLGTTHSDVGAYVCHHWAFPASISQAALHHLTPCGLLDETKRIRPTTRVVHVACRVARALARSDEFDPPTLDVLIRRGVDPTQVIGLRDEVLSAAAPLLTTLG